MANALSPRQTIDELKELRALTGDEHGEQRVAFTPKWVKAREFLRSRFDGLPVEIHNDAAGNFWATLRGESDRELLMGGHFDSVPNGGWLDGCLNTLAAVAVMRRINAQYNGKPPVTVRVVDWADEEGARFGKSLFGSSACSGNLDMDEARGLADKDGIKLPDALKNVGIDFERVKDSGKELKNAAAYLELHIEQGPVLLDMDLPLGAVLGTFGVERHAITFHGQAAHSGSTPMNRRKDAFLAAARMSEEIYKISERSGMGVCTIGSCTTKPGIVTSVVEDCRITLDQRHLDASKLANMHAEAVEASERFAKETGCTVSWERLWHITPAPFHPQLIDFCEEAVKETAGVSHRLPSGPLHDAAEVCMAGVPTVMMFVQSLHGISHNKIEDTKEEHLAMSVEALDRLAEKTMAWIKKTVMTPKLAELNTAPEDIFVHAIGPVYEHSPHFAQRVAAKRPFADIEHLRHALQQEVNHASETEQMDLIKAHPDLVGRAVLTAESQGEQAAAGLTDLSAEEIESFRRNNAAYREKFGFPFIICARMNKKDAILEAFPRRLQNDADTEKKAALDEIHKIAALRLHDILWVN